MRFDEASRHVADSGAVEDAYPSSGILVQRDDVVVLAGVENVGLAVDFADAVAVGVVDPGLLRRDALEGGAPG